MFNETFAAQAAAGFNQTPAQGPYTLAMSNSAIWVSLPNITVDYQSIVKQIRALTNTSDVSELHLPPEYGADETLIEGYRAQLRQLAELYANPCSPSLESAFATGTSVAAVLLHPLSRGTARLNRTHPFEPPVLDYRSASNPIDLAVHIAHTRYLRRMVSTDTLQALGAVGVQPAPEAQSDEELANFVRRNAVQSYMHPCCTAAMLPRDKGGVVGSDLKVHGAEGLRVVDMSVLPMLPAAHLSATAYAVGEKVRLSSVPSSIQMKAVLGRMDLVVICTCEKALTRKMLTNLGCRYHHPTLVQRKLTMDLWEVSKLACVCNIQSVLSKPVVDVFKR